MNFRRLEEIWISETGRAKEFAQRSARIQRRSTLAPSKPGFSFAPGNWSAKPTFRLQKTAYAPVRNTYTPNHIQYFMTAGTNCNAPTP